MERKATERSVNRREIPSFLLTNSNMIYSCHHKLWVEGKPRVGVTDCVIGFPWKHRTRESKPICLLHDRDISHQTRTLTRTCLASPTVMLMSENPKVTLEISVGTLIGLILGFRSLRQFIKSDPLTPIMQFV
jgi:hypothetical protein